MVCIGISLRPLVAGYSRGTEDACCKPVVFNLGGTAHHAVGVGKSSVGVQIEISARSGGRQKIRWAFPS